MVVSRRVAVQVLLTGGHRQSLQLDSDSPLLRGLLDTFVARLAGGTGHVILFQIPLDEGRSALTFTSDQLVALTTEPAVLAGSQDVIVTAQTLALFPARYVLFKDVLGAATKARLLEEAIARAPERVPGRVTTNVPNYRRARVVNRASDLAVDLVAFVRSRLPELCTRLEVPPFPVEGIEAQLTVHSEGDYFHIHTDNGDEQTHTREISYVYYFHRQPKRFTGGELALFDTWREQGQSREVGTPTVLEPVDDSLIVFPSSCLHEVRPVRMLSDDPEDGRFTINGWVRRKESVS